MNNANRYHALIKQLRLMDPTVSVEKLNEYALMTLLDEVDEIQTSELLEAVSDFQESEWSLRDETNSQNRSRQLGVIAA